MTSQKKRSFVKGLVADLEKVLCRVGRKGSLTKDICLVKRLRGPDERV